VGLSRWDSIHHLLRLGLVGPETILDGHCSVTETLSRNRSVRVETAQRSFSVKQPRNPDEPDAQTMWTEATIFWLTAHDPAFRPLAPWLPRFFHYDERQKLLTVEFVTPAVSLAEALFGAGAPPPLLAEAGRAFALLHGAVSLAASGGQAARLLPATMPWVLEIGGAQSRYAPPNSAASWVLGELGRGEAVAALARLRGEWRSDRIVHGDGKAANLLILPDGSVRLIDWEIAAMGHPLWDVAGMLHSMLIPNPGAPPEPLAQAQARARPLAEAFWRGYVAGGPALAGIADPPDLVLRMAGARILQTCFESTHYGSVGPGVAPMLDMAAELMTRPQAARERWSWAA
jgi:hypothetical protein